jgi:hypothetical protein
MEASMKTQRLPQTDSIQELARFWDTHDLDDFEGELEELTEPVFEPSTVIRLDLAPAEAAAVRKIAQAKGVTEVELIHGWVGEHVRGG